MNTYIGAGLLGGDAEYKETPNAKFCKFSVCCEDRYRDKSGEWKTHKSWIPCVKYGGNAESLAKVLTKGTFVVFSGLMRIREYEKDGQKRKAFEIHVAELKFGDPRKVSDGGGAKLRSGAQANPSSEADDSDMPF